MKITKIQAHAGVTFNHPYEQYSNFRPGITIEAEILDGDKADIEAAALQGMADAMCERQRKAILDRCEAENVREMHEANLQRARNQIRSHETQIAYYKRQIESLEAKIAGPAPGRLPNESDIDFEERSRLREESIIRARADIEDHRIRIDAEEEDLAKALDRLAKLEAGEIEPESSDGMIF